jgi:hypothetical protein
MPDVSGRVKKEGAFLSFARFRAQFYLSIRMDRLAWKEGSWPMILMLSPEVSTILSHAEVPQFVKKYPTPVVANSHEFP